MKGEGEKENQRGGIKNLKLKKGIGHEDEGTKEEKRFKRGQKKRGLKNKKGKKRIRTFGKKKKKKE